MEYDYNNLTNIDEAAIVRRTSSVMRRVYAKMTVAMLISAFAAMLMLGNDTLLYTVCAGKGCFFLFVAEVILVIAMTAGLQKMSNLTANLLLGLFAAVNGVTLAPIFLIYTEASIVKTFFVCAATFGAMSVYGFLTTRDLTTWGNYLFYALIGLIVCSLVNMFAKSSNLDFLLSIVGVLLFIGLTAWDTWKIKRWSEVADDSEVSKLSTIGALSLYLDFVNLFLYLLRFFGRRN